MDRTKFFGSKEASTILGIHSRTLYMWGRKKVLLKQ